MTTRSDFRSAPNHGPVHLPWEYTPITTDSDVFLSSRWQFPGGGSLAFRTDHGINSTFSGET